MTAKKLFNRCIRPDTLREVLWVVLLPCSFVWALGAWLRVITGNRRGAYRAKGKTICVGNIHAGGSGKTPLVIEIARYLGEQRCRVVTRGYRGRKRRGSVELDRQIPGGVFDYGDEAWMLGCQLASKIFVGSDRVGSLRAIDAQGFAGYVIMDDGLQDTSFEKDVRLCVISAARDPENGFLLPLGDGRSNFGEIRRCDAVIITGLEAEAKSEGWYAFIARHFPNMPVFSARRNVLGLWDGLRWAKRVSEPVLAFSGIGLWEPFAADVGKLVTIARLQVFSNHMNYSIKHAAWLKKTADEFHLRTLITTEKDWAKIEPLLRGFGLQLLSLRITYDLERGFWQFLKTKLA